MMTWSTFSEKVQQLGFAVTCRALVADGGGYLPEVALPPDQDRRWTCVGDYGQAAGLWVKPLTDEAGALPAERVTALISGCCEFVGTLPDHDVEFGAALAAMAAAAANPDRGRMPA